MSMKISRMATAITSYLREKGYPEKASLKVVGDRYRLSRVERNALFRGVIPEAVCGARKKKARRRAPMSAARASASTGTMFSSPWKATCAGFPVFVSDDGMTRDSSATHGSYRTATVTERGPGCDLRDPALAGARPRRRLRGFAHCVLRANGGGEIRERLSGCPFLFRRPRAFRRLSR